MEITSYTPQQFSIDPTIRRTQSNNDYYITVFPLREEEEGCSHCPQSPGSVYIPRELGCCVSQHFWNWAFSNNINNFLSSVYCIKIVINTVVSCRVFSRNPTSEWMQQVVWRCRSVFNNTVHSFSCKVFSGDGTNCSC